MQGAYTADFLFSVEKRAVAFYEYNYRQLEQDMWWRRVTKERPFNTKSERVTWLFQTASIEQLSPYDGGETSGLMTFDDLQTFTTEYFPAKFGRGFKMSRIRWENFINGSSGQLDPLASWAGAMGEYRNYSPQRQISQLILNGANVTGYDGVPFWSTSHPTHPLISTMGTYANVFTGAASGAYPGACPIDDSVSLETALINMAKILAYITTAVLQPNGAGDPRRLRPVAILHPVRMAPRVHMLLDAMYLPLSANSGGGSADIRPYFAKIGRIEPIQAPELGAAISYTVPYGAATGLSTTVTGSDTTFYILCEEATTTELGSLLVNKRQDWSMRTFAGAAGGGAEGLDAILSRSGDIESHFDGWFGYNLGHPFGIFQCKQS